MLVHLARRTEEAGDERKRKVFWLLAKWTREKTRKKKMKIGF